MNEEAMVKMKVEELRESVDEIEEAIGIEMFVTVVEKEEASGEEVSEKIERCEDLKRKYDEKTAELKRKLGGENVNFDRIKANLIKEIEKLRDMKRDLENEKEIAEKIEHAALEEKNVAEKMERAALEKKNVAEKMERAALGKEDVAKEKAAANAEKEMLENAKRKMIEIAERENIERAALKRKNVAEKMERAALKRKNVAEKMERAALEENDAEKNERAALEENVVEKNERAALEENVAKKMERAALENENLAEKKAGVTAVATSANKEEIAIAEKKNKAERVAAAAAGAREIVKKDSEEIKVENEAALETDEKAGGVAAATADARKIGKRENSEEVAKIAKREKDEGIDKIAKRENEEEIAQIAKKENGEGIDKIAKREKDEETAKIAKRKNDNGRDDVKNDDNANDEKDDEGSDDEEEEKTAKAVRNEDESSDDESVEDEDEDDMKDKEEMLDDEAMETEKPSDEKNMEEEDPSYLERAWKMLELARNIYSIPTNIRKLCDALLALGEVSIENENYAQAGEDLNSCLEKSCMREIAETRYQLGVAPSYQDQHTEAFKYFHDAINILENMLQALKADTFDARVDKIDELELLMPEIANHSFQPAPFFVMDETDAALDNPVERHNETKLPRQFDPGINGDWSCSGLNLNPAAGSERLVPNYVKAATDACTVVERWRDSRLDLNSAVWQRTASAQLGQIKSD